MGQIIKMNGKEITLTTEATPEYRSSYGEFTCNNPEEWAMANGIDEEENEYEIWFEMVNPDAEEIEDAYDWNVTDPLNIVKLA